MPAFPSIEWFDAVREVFNRDERYHGGGAGACDAEIGLVIGDAHYQLSFEGRDCTRASEIDAGGLQALDFYLEMEPASWQAMLENIREHGQAALDYTLNTLDLERDDGLCRGEDQFRADLFFRYNQTFQNFFDASHQVETTFS